MSLNDVIIARLTGDQSAQIAEEVVFGKLISPNVPGADNWPVFDLSVGNRDDTDDQVTKDAAAALMRLKAGVKSPTVTVKPAQFEQFGVTRTFGSPNGTIRKLIGGEAIFREMLEVHGLSGLPVPGWTKRLITARHPVGDIYGAPQFETKAGDRVEVVITHADGQRSTKVVLEDAEDGVLMAQSNTVANAQSFARACVQMAINTKLPLVYGHKETILPIYHGIFVQAFVAEVERHKEAMDAAGIWFGDMLNDAVATKMVSQEGGIIYALNNYEGDLYSDVLGGGAGSLARISSALYGADDVAMFDPAGGTAPDLMAELEKEDGTFGYNPLAHIAAWSDAFTHVGRVHDIPAATAFGYKLWSAVQETYRAGYYTPELEDYTPEGAIIVDCFQFIDEVAGRFSP